jgi:ubiquitin
MISTDSTFRVSWIRVKKGGGGGEFKYSSPNQRSQAGLGTLNYTAYTHTCV